jgi:hypothetical protein
MCFRIHIKDKDGIRLQARWLALNLAILDLALPDLQGLEEKAFRELAKPQVLPA